MTLLGESIMGLSIISALPAIVVGAQNYRQLLWWYCVSSFISDMLGYLLLKLAISKFWVTNIFILAQWLFIGLFLVKIIVPQKHQPSANVAVSTLAIAYVLHTLYKSPVILNYSDGALSLGVFILASILGLYKVLKNLEHTYIEHSPIFVFCAVLLLYSSGSLLMLLAKSYLDHSDAKLMRNLWIVHNSLNILKNLAIAYCLILLKRKPVEQ